MVCPPPLPPSNKFSDEYDYIYYDITARVIYLTSLWGNSVFFLFVCLFIFFFFFFHLCFLHCGCCGDADRQGRRKERSVFVWTSERASEWASRQALGIVGKFTAPTCCSLAISRNFSVDWRRLQIDTSAQEGATPGACAPSRAGVLAPSFFLHFSSHVIAALSQTCL